MTPTRIILISGGAVAALVLAGFGMSVAPLLVLGAVLGVAVVSTTVAWPVGVLCLMMGLGPVDLSILTGGARQLLPALGGLDMSGIRLVAISAGLIAVIATRTDLLRGFLSSGARWYALFLLWAAATLTFSPDPLEGARLLLKVGYLLLVYLVVSAPERTRADLDRLADWALWGAVLILLLDPILVVNGAYDVEAGQEGSVVRVWGPGAHYNPFSFYLLAMLVLCIARFRSRGQTRYLVLGGFSIVWMALTLSRITFLASAVALSVVGVYTAVVDRNWRMLGAIGLLGGMLGLLVLRGVLERTFGRVPSAHELAGLLADPVTLYNSINWQGRQTLWTILWLVFVQHPLTGAGFGASAVALKATLGEGAPHNEYLRIAVDAGLIGFVLYFLAVSGWVIEVVRAIRRRVPGAEEFTLPALAALAAWAVIAITDNAFDYYGPFTQYVAFLVAGAVVVTRAPATAAKPATASVSSNGPEPFSAVASIPTAEPAP